MKKLLLFACMAVMAISASAQQKAVVSEAIKLNVNNAKMMSKDALKDLNSPAALKMKAIKGNKSEAASKVAGKMKSPASADINGVYIQDDFKDFHACSEMFISDTTIVYSSEDGTESVSFNKFVVFADGYVQVPAIYDEKTSALTIPGGMYCYDDEDYGRFALFCINDEDDVTDEDLTFTYDELTNSFYLDQAGYYIYMVDYSNSKQAAYAWTTGYGTAFLPANGEMDFYISAGGSSPWEESWCFVRIEEDVETKTITVYNYINRCAIDHKVNDDYSVTIAKGQPIQMVYDEKDNELIAGIFALDSDDAGKLSYSWNRDLVARLACGLMTEDGKMKEFKPGTEEFNTYGANAINSGENFISGIYGQGYVDFYAIPYITSYQPLQLGPVPAAINNVVSNNATSKATFNLAGQRVNKDFKGVVVKDGKKMIMK